MDTLFDVKERAIVLTDKAAQWYLDLPILDKERKLSESHVEELRRKMASGDFIPQNVQLATVEVDGVTYKANGQHTCQARLAFNGSHNYKVRHLHCIATDNENAARFYMQFDPTFSGRSFGHNSGMYWQNIGLTDNCSKRAVHMAACALAFDKGGRTEHGRTSIKGQDKIMLPAQSPACVDFISEFCNPGSNQFLCREPVACAVWQTALASKAAAKDFWSAVRDGELLKRSHPASALREYLLRTSPNMGRGASRGRKDTFHEMYSRCIHAWNAFREGRTTDLKVYKDAPLPRAK